MVEPLPGYWYHSLRTRPRDHLIPLAASNYTGKASLRVCAGVSSIRPDWDIKESSIIDVETDTLANILEPFPDLVNKCELCSIDVEGYEKQVLEGIDFKNFRPSVFVVEYYRFTQDGSYGGSLEQEWEYILFENGYKRVASTELNHIYQRVDN